MAEQSQSASDDFAAMMGLADQGEQKAAEDRGVALKRELSSLVGRYPAELQRTRQLIANRAELAKATRARLDDLRQALTALEPLVRAEHGRIQGEVRLMQGLMIGLILLIALAVDRIQRNLTRVLGRLMQALSHWASGTSASPSTWIHASTTCAVSRAPWRACGPTWATWWAPSATTPSRC